MSAILVVDDDPIHGNYLATLLQRNGETVELTLSAEVALARLARGGVDLVITDILMPEIDGIELVQQIHRTYPQVGMIGVTGCDPLLRGPAKLLMAHFGLRSLLPKPIDVIALKLAVEESRGRGSYGGNQ